MKNKKILTLSIACLAAIGMTGCDDISTTSVSETTENGTSETTSLAEWVDYSSPIVLDHDYKNHDFYTDGIGQMTLKTCIDGDTAHFYPSVRTTSSDIVKSRFYGIDTPESTGQVEEWGKAASNFTKEKLNTAAQYGTIVVSSPFSEYSTPETDSTGTRYLSLIWVNYDTPDADYTDLVLLNLDIVQEGYSYVKGVSDIPDYANTFYAAEAQAKAYKLNLFSDEKDPLFNYGDYVDTSLLDIKKEIEKEIDDPNYKNAYDNVKVRIQGTVAGYSNNVLYLQSYFSTDNGGRNGGEYAGINIFCGMTTIPTKFKTINTYIEVCGLALDSATFGFQISDVTFKRSSTNPDDATVLITAEDNTDEFKLHTFEKTAKELEDSKYDCLNCSISVTDKVVVDSFYINDSDEITIGLAGYDFGVYIPFLFYGNSAMPNDVWNDEADFIGKSFQLSGIYTYHIQTSGNIVYQVTLRGSDDFVNSTVAE
ncbi:MAG: thermonuclease family protein [Bacteroidaceae bacterium]